MKGGESMVEVHNQAYPSAAKLLEQDFASFNLLSRILSDPLDTIITDEESFIITFSSPVYPVWIWSKDDISSSGIELIWDIVNTRFPLSDGNRYNLKEPLSRSIIDLAEKSGIRAESILHLLAYECKSVIHPSSAVEGYLHQCTERDVNILTDWLEAFHKELQMDEAPRDFYYQDILDRMHNGAFFLWKVGDTPVSMCSFAESPVFCSVSSVFTPVQYRRNHFAENLVAAVTQIILNTGNRALLYADANYAASNACYQKIGYELVGSLVSLGASDK